MTSFIHLIVNAFIFVVVAGSLACQKDENFIEAAS
jgi:hypothetical protein